MAARPSIETRPASISSWIRVRLNSAQCAVTMRSSRWPASLGATSNSRFISLPFGFLSFGNSRCGMAVDEKDIEKDERGANGDCGIGDVEGGVVIGAEPYLKEICNRAVIDAVGYIAGRSAEKKREAGGGQGTATVGCNDQPGECGDDHNRDSDQGEAHPGRGRVREHTKCDAWIAAVDEIDKIMDQFWTPAFGGLGLDR